MYIRFGMCVCVYACRLLCVCVHVFTGVRMYVRVYVFVYVFVRVCDFASVSAFLHMCVYYVRKSTNIKLATFDVLFACQV